MLYSQDTNSEAHFSFDSTSFRLQLTPYYIKRRLSPRGMNSLHTQTVHLVDLQRCHMISLVEMRESKWPIRTGIRGGKTNKNKTSLFYKVAKQPRFSKRPSWVSFIRRIWEDFFFFLAVYFNICKKTNKKNNEMCNCKALMYFRLKTPWQQTSGLLRTLKISYRFVSFYIKIFDAFVCAWLYRHELYCCGLLFVFFKWVQQSCTSH